MEYFNYFLCGTASGCVGTFVSQPFYVLKTELQNGKNPFQRLETFKKTNGPKKLALYKDIKFLYTGTQMMCLGLSCEKMLVFGTYNSTLTFFGLDRERFSHSLFAGFISGLAGSFASTATEQIAIDKIEKVKNYSLNHLYKGILPTMGRESIGFAVYFTAYDQLSKKYNKEKKITKTMGIGAVSITTALAFFYPLDKIKTNVQAGKKIELNDLKTVYRGAHFGLLRAIPFHVTCFVVFEWLNSMNFPKQYNYYLNR